ncbi:CHAT domain-containing tetratricopeptide repeat protein [Acaryochloris thomasi]|nr:tetratricopeptide repeat protein [Acaryochloris thomasi]
MQHSWAKQSVKVQGADVQADSLRLSLGQKPQWSGSLLMAQADIDGERQRSLEEAKQLNQQVVQLYKQGRFSEAVAFSQRVLSIREKVLGAGHPDIATSLNNLALLYHSQGLYSKAEPLFQRALNIDEKVLGAGHPDIATSLNNLAELYRSQGLHSKAEPLHQRALSIREKALSVEHPHVAISLNNLAGLYHSQGLYSKAGPLFQRALSIREKVFGADHPDVAVSLNNLALLYRSQGLYSKAEPLFQRALSTNEKVLGAEHPNVATGLNNLAELYRSQGLYSKAEPLHQHALNIQEKALGADHPDVAGSLNNLALLYRSQGLYSKAEPLFQRALSTYEKMLGAEHPSVATGLNNLAELYRSQGLYSKAEPLCQRALNIREKTLGADHADVAQSLNNLALLYSSQGLYSKAAPLYQRALSIREKTLGSQHPDVADSLNNLASLYDSQGLYSKAVPLYQRALSIYENVLGAEHPHVATSLNNLALLHHEQGNLTLTHQLFSRAADIEERNLDLMLSTSSESRKQAYIATLAGTTDAMLSFSIDASESPSFSQLAFITILRRKGRVLSSLINSFQSLRQNLSSTDRPLLDQLQALRSQRATLTFQGPDQLPPKQHQATLTQLKIQEDQLENQLARKSAEFQAETQSVTTAGIQEQIPQGAALIELVKYSPFNAKAIKQESQWGTPHYAAYILNADGTLQWTDLGKAAPIDQTVTQFRQALKSNTSNIKPIARKLDQQIMQPIRAKLGNTRQLLLSPDSQLNLIPFAALVDENNQYLVENYDITYLSSGRDLLTLQTTNSKQKLQPPVIIANPDYQSPGESIKIASAQAAKNRSSQDLNLSFGPLPGTKAEAEQLQKLLPQSTLFTQNQATENALKQVKSPEILHIATHGFFLETDLEAVSTPNNNRASISVVSQKPPKAKQEKKYENPLLRSGLALAGANPRKSGTEDGIFTALEATNLNLQGTKLVVLSACETGLGNVENGEGVYGLRRAFVMAGSESQVLSLWKVDDIGTKDLMVKYYQRLLNKEGRGEALRKTQLEMLNSPKYQHPYYWAAFIPSGDWKPIR